MTKTEIAQAFSGGKFDKCMDYLTEQTIWHTPGEQYLVGKMEIQLYCKKISAYFDSITTNFKQLNLIENDNCVAINGTAEFLRDEKRVSFVYSNMTRIYKLVLFDYRPGRGRDGPDDILKDFQGYLQTDEYSAYEAFDRRPGITLLHCMAHARRKFHESLQNDQPRAEYALGLFQQLYAIERTIKEHELTGDEVVQLRQQKAVPILHTLKSWMVEEYPKLVVKKSPISQAMGYFLPRWEKLCIYTKEARLNIDNNLLENAIRPVAVGRKNYLFADSHEAAQRAAMVYSLLATCKLHNINP